MIKSANLIRVSGTADSGRNRPIRGGIRAVTDQYHDAYVKPSGWCELTDSSVVREYVSVCVAGLLGLPVCEPFWADCPDDLKGFQPEGKTSLGDCTWPAFASSHAGPQWRIWATTDSLSPKALATAVSILAFDGFLDNPDRRQKNPNLLIKGNELRIIDHELAFSFLDLMPFLRGAPPWEKSGLDWITEGDRQHILYPTLRDSTQIDANQVKQSWSVLDDTDLNAILDELPTTFNSAKMQVETAIQRVKDVRDNIDGCIAELERILS